MQSIVNSVIPVLSEVPASTARLYCRSAPIAFLSLPVKTSITPTRTITNNLAVIPVLGTGVCMQSVNLLTLSFCLTLILIH